MTNQQNTPPEQPIKVVNVKWEGRTKYTYYSDGIVKITRYKGKRKIYYGRIFAALILLFLLILGVRQIIFGSSDTDSNKISANSSMPEQSDDSAAVGDTDSSKTDSSESTDSTDSADSMDSLVAAYSDMDISVCIDPGHGGYDTGAVADDGTKESDQMLSLGLKMKSYLERCGVTVYMTRETDRQVSLTERCSVANRSGADFYISLHRCSTADTDSDDSGNNSNDRGTEIWISSVSPEYDTALAQNIMDALEITGISNTLGVKTGYFNLPEQNFQVNSDTDMPSCLIELGYMSSDVDNRLFVEKEDDYAKSIADAAIETAIKLDVVETSGKRKLGQQLVSAEKQNSSSSSDSDSDSDTDTDTNSDTDTDTNTDTDNVIE